MVIDVSTPATGVGGTCPRSRVNEEQNRVENRRNGNSDGDGNGNGKDDGVSVSIQSTA